MFFRGVEGGGGGGARVILWDGTCRLLHRGSSVMAISGSYS